MLALTLRQPWAHATLHGKNPENRRWRTHVRETIALHAGAESGVDPFASADPLVAQILRRTVDPLTGELTLVYGAVLALADIVDVHVEDGRGCCRPWGEPGVYHWKWANVRPLVTPVPVAGHQRLWTLPGDVAERVASTPLRWPVPSTPYLPPVARERAR